MRRHSHKWYWFYIPHFDTTFTLQYVSFIYPFHPWCQQTWPMIYTRMTRQVTHIVLVLCLCTKSSFYGLLWFVAICQPLTCRDRINPVQHSQYCGCWFSGCLRRQVISIPDIDYVEWVGPCLTRGSISATCVMLMRSNDIKCKCMYMFPLKNST